VVGSLFATVFVPLVVSNSLVFPYMSAKGHLFRLLVEVAVAGWAMLAVTDPSQRPRSSPIFWALAAFVLCLGLADVSGIRPWASLLGDLERMEGWNTHVHLLAYFVVLPVGLAGGGLWRRFWRLSLAVSLVVTVVALAQLAGAVPMNSPSGRIDGTLGNPSFLAAYLAFHIWLAAFLALDQRTSNRARLFLVAILLVEGAALYFTATRSAMLGVMAGTLVAVLLMLCCERERTQVRRMAAVVAVGGLILVAGFVLLRGHPFVSNSPVLGRFAAISPTELTSQSRLLAWGAALDGAAERPWLGWGQGNFSVVYARHYDPRLYTQDPFFDRVHNAFLEWLVAGGVVGLLAFCSVVAAFVVVVWRGGTFNAVERSLLTGLAGGYAVHASFLFDTLTSFMLAIAVLAWVHFRVTADRPMAGVDGPRSRRGWAAVALAVVAAATVGAVVTWRTVASERALLRAVRPDPSGLGGTLASFQAALRHRTPATSKVRQRLLTTAVEIGRSRPDDVETLARLTSLGRLEIARQIEACPLDVRSQVALASFLRRFSATDEARALLDRAHGLAPRMQHILFEMGILELGRGRFEEALEILRSAYELAPEWTEARNRYAAAAIMADRRQLAEELLVPDEGTIALGDEWLIAAFRASGDLPNLVAALEARLRIIPPEGREASRLRRELAGARRALADQGVPPMPG
jgi:O-antigen ligase